MRKPGQTPRTFLSVGMALAALLATGCVAKVGAEDVRVPDNSADICTNQCSSIGMRLSAVAIMANTVGCVCQPAQAAALSAAEAAESGTAAAGMATIMMQRRAAQQQQQQQMQAAK